MNIAKRKRKHLSAIKTAHTLAGTFIFAGFLLILIGAAVGTYLFQTDISGTSTAAVIDSIIPAPTAEQSSPDAIETDSLDAGIAAVAGAVHTLGVKERSRSILETLEWDDLWDILIIAFMVLWFGYVLRVLSILAETQFIDFEKSD